MLSKELRIEYHELFQKEKKKSSVQYPMKIVNELRELCFRSIIFKFGIIFCCVTDI